MSATKYEFDLYEREMKVKALLEGLRSGEWLDAQVFAPLRWMVPGLVPEGFTLMVGGPKVGKSWLIYGVALACASGGYVLGHLKVEQRPVLYLALEDGDRRLQQRGRVLMQGEPVGATILAYFLLDEDVAAGQLAAMAVVIVALSVLAYSEAREARIYVEPAPG